MKNILYFDTAGRDAFSHPFAAELTKQGYELVAMALVEEGMLSLIQAHDPDLVLMPIVQQTQLDTLQIALRLWQVLEIPVIFVIHEPAELLQLRTLMPTLPFGYVNAGGPVENWHYGIESALHWSAILLRSQAASARTAATSPSLEVGQGRLAGVAEQPAALTHKEQSKSYFRLLTRAVEQSPASVLITNVRGDIEYVNTKFTQVTGYTFDEVVGQNPRILKSGEMPKQLYRELWQTILSGGCWAGALHNRRKDGTLFWEHAVIQGITDEEGRVNHLLAVKEDITDQLEAERRLRASEAELLAIFENSQVGILLLGEGRILDKCNQRLAEILGYDSPAEMRGISMRQLHLSEERFHDFGREHYQPLTNRETVRVEYQLRRKHGESVWCSLSGKAMDRKLPADLNKGVVWVADEISQRKQAELDLQAANLALNEEHELFAGGPVMVFRWLPKPGWPVTYCSKNILSALGYQAEAFTCGHIQFGDLLHPEDRQRVGDEVTQALARGEAAFEQECRLRHADGEYRDFYDFTRVIRDESGEVCLLHGYLLDITANKQHERENNRFQRELQHARKMEALGQLTGGVAHEFNNMLAVILGHTGLISARLGPQADDKLLTYLRHIENAGQRSRDLVRQMLSFSRADETAPSRVLPGPLVQEIVNLARAMLPSSIEIDYRAEAELPDILMDPGALQQILMNLFVNARDAMSDQGRLGVGLRFVPMVSGECNTCHMRLRGDWLELTVEDSGDGIAPDHIERVFEPFFTTKPVGNGTGLGLSVVQGLTERHGGHIMVQSRQGKGTRFRLLFPPMSERESLAHAIEPKPAATGVTPLTGRVLVVDDEAAIVELLREILHEHGLQVSVMTQSRQALAHLQDPGQVYDLLITDQTMPELTGRELVEQARRLRPDMRVILCSGHSDLINAENATRYGIDCFLQKPIDLKTLRECVVSLFGADPTVR